MLDNSKARLSSTAMAPESYKVDCIIESDIRGNQTNYNHSSMDEQNKGNQFSKSDPTGREHFNCYPGQSLYVLLFTDSANFTFFLFGMSVIHYHLTWQGI